MDIDRCKDVDIRMIYQTRMDIDRCKDVDIGRRMKGYVDRCRQFLFPSKDCLKGMRVWRPLSWVFLRFSAGRVMDSGIASLSGAVAWASDSESLFVEPSGVL
ncbi:hypothetical protein F2Q70_00012230 [Brassica cretica]|uniref:Uncharacterized protein n=1 Tax=Brassica cretica TaxID=69181 RepID=A0A8S9MGQ5_BRACR|nr:hypothetical protein F2Q70_00012230 [Brassica cretica]